MVLQILKRAKTVRRFLSALRPDKEGFIYLISVKQWLLDVCFLEQLHSSTQFKQARYRARQCVRALSRQPRLRLKRIDFLALLHVLPDAELLRVADSLLMESKEMRHFVVDNTFLSGAQHGQVNKDTMREWLTCEPERMSASVIQKRKLVLAAIDKLADMVTLKEARKLFKDWSLRDIRVSSSRLVRKRAMNFKGCEAALVVLHVRIGDGVEKPIKIHKQDSPSYLAHLFANKHKLPVSVVSLLTHLIEDNQREAVLRLGEGDDSVLKDMDPEEDTSEWKCTVTRRKKRKESVSPAERIDVLLHNVGDLEAQEAGGGANAEVQDAELSEPESPVEDLNSSVSTEAEAESTVVDLEQPSSESDGGNEYSETYSVLGDYLTTPKAADSPTAGDVEDEPVVQDEKDKEDEQQPVSGNEEDHDESGEVEVQAETSAPLDQGEAGSCTPDAKVVPDGSSNELEGTSS